MIRRILLFAAVIGGSAIAVGQDGPVVPNPDSERIMRKIRQLDIMNQLLPVLLRPDQIKSLLPPVEKARAADRKLQQTEAAELKEFEDEVDSSLSEAKAKLKVPTREVLAKSLKLLIDFNVRRLSMVTEHVELVLKKVEEVFDEGQIKAAANAFDPKLVNPGMDPAKLTERDKLKTWVRLVLMDPLAYDILVELSQRKTGSDGQ